MSAAELLDEVSHQAGPERGPMLRLVGEAAVVPEVLKPVSITYDVPLIYLNIFSQQRAGRNKEQDALTESLRSGQINPVNIVLASGELVEQYRQWTNATWGGNVREEDLFPLPLPENAHERPSDETIERMYVILVAGHSRVEGKRAIARDDGTPMEEATVEARIHEVETIDQMLQIQLRENVHSQPAKDRELRAVGEMFKWLDEESLRLTGRPKEKRAFAHEYGVSEDTVRVAANYVALPKEIRDFSDNDGLPFNIITELARARTAIITNARYLAAQEPENKIEQGLDVDEIKRREAAQEDRVKALELSEYGYLLSVIDKKGYTSKRNSSKACTVIKAHASTIRDVIAGRRAVELTMMDTLFTDEETLVGRVERLTRETGRNLRDFLRDQGLLDRHYAGRIAELAGLSIEAAQQDQVADALKNELGLVEIGTESVA